MPIFSSGFTKLTNLPGMNKATPTAAVQSFQNQLSTDFPTGGQAAQRQRIPATEWLTTPTPKPSEVALAPQRTSDAIRDSNRRMLAQAAVQGQQRRAQQAQSMQGQYQGRAGGWQNPGGGNNQQGVIGPGGPAVSRIQGILRNFPGLRITEVGGNRQYDRAHGVPRVANSYHYDAKNPAIDIAGSTQDLDRLYAELVRQGGWRQILWRSPGHYNHLHVAFDGGIVGAPGPMGTKQVPIDGLNPVSLGPDTEPAMLSPGEVVVTKAAADAIGPENLVAANQEMAGAPAPAPRPPQGRDVAPLVLQAYQKLGQQHAAVVQGQAVPGIRTALSNLQPGDLVAWKDGSHVAVYAGNGEVLVPGRQNASRRALWAPPDAVYGIALRLPGE